MNTIRLGRESMKQVTNLNKRNELLNNIQVELKKNRNIHIYYGGKRISIYEIKNNPKFNVAFRQKYNVVELCLRRGSTPLRFMDNGGRIYHFIFQIKPYSSREPEIDPPHSATISKKKGMKFKKENMRFVSISHKKPNQYVQQKVKTVVVNKQLPQRNIFDNLYDFIKRSEF